MSTRSKQKYVGIEQELERRICHGLACQWETELWALPATNREQMRMPIFSLRNIKSHHAYWSRKTREIVFSRNFVLNHPWIYVRDVLRHEMAHQFTDEVLGGGDETPHGPLFREACRFLRADPRASGNYLPLSQWVLEGKASQNDRILDRINKLFSLGQSSNQHEAESALAKAHELILKYNLDLLASEKQRKFYSMCVGKPLLCFPRHYSYLAHLLQDFYFVRVIRIWAYVLEKGKTGSVLEISGTRENLKLASYVYDFVQRFIDERWNLYSKENGLSRRRKTDFGIGIIRGFRNKLESQEKGMIRKDQKAYALIKTGDTRLAEYYKYMYPRCRTSRYGERIKDAKVQNDGEKVGKTMVISKPIETTRNCRKLLIMG